MQEMTHVKMFIVLSLISISFFVQVLSRPPDVAPPLPELGPDHSCFQAINDPNVYLAGSLTPDLSAAPFAIIMRVQIQVDLEESLPPKFEFAEYHMKLIDRGCPSSLKISMGIDKLSGLSATITLFLAHNGVHLTTYDIKISKNVQTGIQQVKDIFDFFGLFIQIDKASGQTIQKPSPVTLAKLLDVYDQIDTNKGYICMMKKTDRFVIEPTLSQSSSRLPIYNSVTARIFAGNYFLTAYHMAAWPCPSLKTPRVSNIVWMLPLSREPISVIFTFNPIRREHSQDHISLLNDKTNILHFTTPNIVQKSVNAEDSDIGTARRIYMMSTTDLQQRCHDNTYAYTKVVEYRDLENKRQTRTLGYYHEREYDTYAGIKYIKHTLMQNMLTCIPVPVTRVSIT